MNSCTFVNHVDQEPPTCVWVWNGLAAGNACHCSSCVEYERARGGEQVRNGMSPSSRTTTFLRTTIHQRETVFGSRWFHASYPSVRLDFRVVFSQRTETETRTRTETTHGATENTWDTWVGAIASTTDSVDARRPRRRYYAKRERKANWTERRSLRSFGSCVFALVPLSPATRTATTTTPTPTPTPLVATMARRRNRRPKRPHLARFSTNILSFSQPLSLSLLSYVPLLLSSLSLARSFFPTFSSPLPVLPVSFSLQPASPPSRPALPCVPLALALPTTLSILQEKPCAAFHLLQPATRSGGYESSALSYARCALPERSLKGVDLSATDLPFSSFQWLSVPLVAECFPWIGSWILIGSSLSFSAPVTRSLYKLTVVLLCKFCSRSGEASRRKGRLETIRYGTIVVFPAGDGIARRTTASTGEEALGDFFRAVSRGRDKRRTSVGRGPLKM